MSFDYLLFDLDGTLTDPYEGITKSVVYALEKLGEPIPPQEKLKDYIGPPLDESFSGFNGLRGERVTEAIRLFRERYFAVGKFENRPLVGATELLEQLSGAGKTLILCTSKLAETAEEICEKFGFNKHFAFVGGATLDGTRAKKCDVIRYCLEKTGVADKSRAVMIGDRYHDINGAREAGVASIGVLVGYGSRAELEDAGADYIAEKLDDVAKIVL